MRNKDHPFDQKPPMRGGILALLCAASLLFTVISFLTWEGKGDGAVSLAVSGFEQFLDENRAIAVFLGLEDH